jgi:SAM-dependent methyltransferase
VSFTKAIFHLSRSLDPRWILERRVLAGFLGEGGNGLLLDLACHDGFKSEFLATYGFRVVGIDVNEAAIGTARAVFGGSGRDFLVGSATQLPFQTASFHKIACLHSLTMFHSPIEALKEMERVLSDDGELVLTVSSVEAPWSNLRKYSFSTLESSLSDTGFEILDACAYINAPILRWNERARLGWSPGWYRLAKMPLYLASLPFAAAERPGKGSGYILGARARKKKRPKPGRLGVA